MMTTLATRSLGVWILKNGDHLSRFLSLSVLLCILGCWDPAYGDLGAANGCPAGKTAYQGVCVDQAGGSDAGVVADAGTTADGGQSSFDTGPFDAGPPPPPGAIVSLSLSQWNTCFIK